MPRSWRRAAATALVLGGFAAGDGSAEVFEVGPDAVQPYSIQDAIDAALAAGSGDHEVRLQGVVFADVATIHVPSSFVTGSLRVTGGWNATFSERSAATPTEIDGTGTGWVVRMRPAGDATLVLEDLTIRGGLTNQHGGGALFEPFDGARLEIRRCTFAHNQAESGGGLTVNVGDATTVLIEDSRFLDNLATSVGGGIYVIASQSAQFIVRRNQIAANRLSAPPTYPAIGAGITAVWCGAASGEVSDNLVQGNEILGEGAQIASGGAFWQSNCGTPATGVVALRRNRWLAGAAHHAEQLSLTSAGAGTLLFTDTLVAGGSAGGVVFEAQDTSLLHLTHLTVVDQAGAGIAGSADPGAAATLYDSIVFDNGTDESPPGIDAGSNLVGVDPLFSADYHPGGPAIDTATASPPGGLGPTDLLGRPRTIGAAPDIGAIEVPELPGRGATLLAMAVVWARARRRRYGACSSTDTDPCSP